jgi:hypothetical protein
MFWARPRVLGATAFWARPHVLGAIPNMIKGAAAPRTDKRAQK